MQWLRREQQLEYRQYRWVQLKQTDATRHKGLNFFNVDRKVPIERKRKTKKRKLELDVVWEPKFVNEVKKQMVYEYVDDITGVNMVEIHVDLLPVSCRETIGPKVGRFNATAGGNLSVRCQANEKPIIKVGQDESIFKMYTLNRSRWTMSKKAPPRKKTEGKGNMKVVFLDEIYGFAYNTLSEDQWAQFQRERAPGFKFEKPACVHWVYGAEKAKTNIRNEQLGIEREDGDGLLTVRISDFCSHPGPIVCLHVRVACL